MGIINSKKPNTLFRCLQQLLPVGTTHITTNGLHNVRNYEYADVSVPQGITPTGTINIENNGDYDVTSYANAHVAVSGGGITPTGTYNITSNGIYDITTYANVDVNVAGGNPHILHGEFQKDGNNPIYLDLNLATNGQIPYYITIKPKNEYDLPILSGGKNLVNLFSSKSDKYNPFSSSGYTQVYGGYVSVNGLFTASPSATQGFNAFFFWNRFNHEIALNPTDISLLLKDNVTYEYDVYVNEVKLNLSSATLTNDTYTFSINDTLEIAPRIQNVGVLVDDHLTNITQLSLGTLTNTSYHSTNVSYDFSCIDMTTAGSYTGYITVNWNGAYKTFTITVVVQ